MARIPLAEIERLKSEISVERLAEGAGITLRRAGADLIGLCPFHADREPSLVITPEKNLWHCLGACQAGGSSIDWVMKMNGVSFRHAVELLREGITSLAADRGKGAVKQGTVRKLPLPVALDADDQALLNQSIAYYHERLKSTPEALAYLLARGIGAAEAIERFRLGFADRTLGLRLPEKNRLVGAAMRAQLQRIGILRGSGHEHFNGSIVIPVMDEAGNVTEVYGRKITRALRAGTPDHLYLPGQGRGTARGVWNIHALQACKEIILCEALIDALTFWCAGYRNVTAAYGVEGFTDDMLAAMKRYGTERVLIAYDRDDAGERAAGKLAEALIGEGIECYRIQFPKGMDANEYAQKVQPADKSLGLAIRKAVWLGKGNAPAVASRPAPIAALQPIALDDSMVSAMTEDARADTDALAEPEETVLPLAAEPLPPLPATPMPVLPAAEIAAEVKETEVVFSFGEQGEARRYRVRGLAKNLAYDVMKVNVLTAKGEAFHVDTLDLYSARARVAYTAQAAAELGVACDVVKADLGRVLLKLEALQEAAIKQALAKKPEAHAITEPEREAAMTLLRAPDLVERILDDLAACGIVGENTNKLVGYLAATSRKLDQPLAVLVQSSSAAGKSSLMDAVLAMMPEEERIKYSAVTGQSLFYMGETNLKHKILAIVEEEGASRASYALKLLQSEGELTIASTGKDAQTGNLVTQEYRVEGPVMMFLTTTAIDIDPELQNRCLTLSIDEGREQTQAIHALQRQKRTLEGLAARARKVEILAVHRNAQRLLRPLGVMNPYANRLSFPDTATRLRRDHEKYLTLIDTIALLYQYQREVKVMPRGGGGGGEPLEYIEATIHDIALANTLAHEVLGRSLDELPPQTRRVLALLDGFVSAQASAQGMARAEVRFSRREVREASGMGDTQLRLHLARLVELEYVLARRDGPGGRLVYELAYDGGGRDGRPFVPGLIDAEALDAIGTTRELAGVNSEVAGRLRAECGPIAGGSRSVQSAEKPRQSGVSSHSTPKAAKPHCSGGNGKTSSYPQILPLAAAGGE